MQEKKIITHIVTWLNKYIYSSKAKGFVVGISGGIDSAVSSTIGAKTGLPTLCIEMPIHQSIKQVERANNHVNWLKKNYNNKVKYVLLKGIGNPIIDQDVDNELFFKAFDFYNE